VVGVLAAIAAPNMRDMVVRTRLKTAASDLHTSLSFARSEAIKRNAGMQVVPVSAADWTQGWSVQVQAAGTVLSRQDPYQNITITTTNAAYTAGTVANVTFAGTGRESGSAGAGIAFVISSATYPIAARCVTIDPSGRAAIRMDRNGNAADGCN
jgi:type IV fimbrial biogenesis protein FimT